MQKIQILIVETDGAKNTAGFNALAAEYELVYAENYAKALDIFKSKNIKLVISDLHLEKGKSGVDLLRVIKGFNENIPVIMLTEYNEIDEALGSLPDGAYDYILKPVKKDELSIAIKKALRFSKIQEENRILKLELGRQYDFKKIIGNSEKMRTVFRLLEKVIDSRANVLILGDSGTGKELIAKAIHFNSKYKDKPFIATSCAALTESLLESQLFGYKKGSFTGAYEDRRGFFEAADGGTIFLDEIGDMSPKLQMKLLRVLQEGEVQRVGETKTRKIDVRVLSATNKDLVNAIKQNRFREDLYYRINVVSILLPPLKERREDIPLLADSMIKKYAGKFHKEVKEIDKDAMDLLLKYDYPGNVRELENIIERAIVLAESKIIRVKDLPLYLNPEKKDGIDIIGDVPKSNEELKRAKMQAGIELEKKFLFFVLKKYRGNISEASKETKINRSVLHEMIRKNEIDVEEFR